MSMYLNDDRSCIFIDNAVIYLPAPRLPFAPNDKPMVVAPVDGKNEAALGTPVLFESLNISSLFQRRLDPGNLDRTTSR
jgi:hypothetical protein